MGVSDEGEKVPEMSMELALMLRHSIHTISSMMEELSVKSDPVSVNALTQFSLSLAAELTTFDVTQAESAFILRIVKNILPKV